MCFMGDTNLNECCTHWALFLLSDSHRSAFQFGGLQLHKAPELLIKSLSWLPVIFLFISGKRLITLTERHKEDNLAYLSELDLINVFCSSAVIETLPRRINFFRRIKWATSKEFNTWTDCVIIFLCCYIHMSTQADMFSGAPKSHWGERWSRLWISLSYSLCIHG